MDATAAWVERDEARVWHGFTQMAAYADNRPVIVERAEGRELIDVDGRRYLDAISSLWVTTLGHRVPELDAAARSTSWDGWPTRTMLGNGNTVVVELAEALAAVVPVDDPRFLFASDGAAAVEQALKIAFQYWWNQGVRTRTRYLALGDAYHGDTVGSLSLGAGGFGTDLFDPLRFRRRASARPATATRTGWPRPSGCSTRTPAQLAAVVIEPLVQGAAGMYVADAGRRRPAWAGPARRPACCSICDEVATGFGRTGTLFASERCGLRPDLLCLGKGITGGYLPMSATVAVGPGGRRLPRRGPRARRPSTTGTATAATPWPPRWPCATWGCSRNGTCSTTCAPGRRSSPSAWPPTWPAVPRWPRSGSRGLMAGVELAPARPGLRWGRRVCAAAVERGVLLRPLGDVVVLMPILTSTAEEIDRIVDVSGRTPSTDGCR